MQYQLQLLMSLSHLQSRQLFGEDEEGEDDLDAAEKAGENGILHY